MQQNDEKQMEFCAKSDFASFADKQKGVLLLPKINNDSFVINKDTLHVQHNSPSHPNAKSDCRYAISFCRFRCHRTRASARGS